MLDKVEQELVSEFKEIFESKQGQRTASQKAPRELAYFGSLDDMAYDLYWEKQANIWFRNLKADKSVSSKTITDLQKAINVFGKAITSAFNEM